MKNIKKTDLVNFILKQKNKLKKYFSQSKVFWKEVANNYKRINSLL